MVYKCIHFVFDLYCEILWINSLSHSFQIPQVYTLTSRDSWDTSWLHVQGKDRQLLRTAWTKLGSPGTFAQDDFVIATVCHWYQCGCQSTLNMLSIHNPCSFQIEFFSSVCRWQPNSTLLSNRVPESKWRAMVRKYTEVRSSRRDSQLRQHVFSQLTTSLHFYGHGFQPPPPSAAVATASS